MRRGTAKPNFAKDMFTYVREHCEVKMSSERDEDDADDREFWVTLKDALDTLVDSAEEEGYHPFIAQTTLAAKYPDPSNKTRISYQTYATFVANIIITSPRQHPPVWGWYETLTRAASLDDKANKEEEKYEDVLTALDEAFIRLSFVRWVLQLYLL